jgi:hypothetical protein
MNTTQIQTGDIMLVQTNTILARTIQFFQKLRYREGGEYNHAGVFEWINNVLYVVEAIKTGIQRTDFVKEYSKDKYKSIICLKPKFDISKSDFSTFMQPYIGTTKYDKWDLAWYQLVRMVTGSWIGSSIIHEKHFICGQWVAYCYNKLAGYTKEMPAVTYIAPIDLYLNTNFSHFVIK